MPTVTITRQWPDGGVLVMETSSDLDSLDEVCAAAARLDAEMCPDGDD